MSETLKVLTQAFIGESQARNRYTFYSKKAKKEGYIQISNIFNETAEQEKEHATQLFTMIQAIRKEENEIEVNASAPLIFGDTKANLKAAIEGELYEKDIMYPDFAKIALEEGYEPFSKQLESIAIAEGHHAERYGKLLKVLEDGSVFKKNQPVVWVCAECGYIHVGEEAPEICPSCKHDQGYYYLMNEEY